MECELMENMKSLIWRMSHSKKYLYGAYVDERDLVLYSINYKGDFVDADEIYSKYWQDLIVILEKWCNGAHVEGEINGTPYYSETWKDAPLLSIELNQGTRVMMRKPQASLIVELLKERS